MIEYTNSLTNGILEVWRPQNNDWFSSNDLNNKNHGKFFIIIISFSFHNN